MTDSCAGKIPGGILSRTRRRSSYIFFTSFTPLTHLCHTFHHIRHTSAASGKSRQDFPDAPRNPLVHGIFLRKPVQECPDSFFGKVLPEISAARPGQKACAYGSLGKTRSSFRMSAVGSPVAISPGAFTCAFPVRLSLGIIKGKGRPLPGPAPSSLPLRFLISPLLSSGIPPARRG